jgi:Fic family protein
MKKLIATAAIYASLACWANCAGPKTVQVPMVLTEQQQTKVRQIRQEYKVKRAEVTKQLKKLREEEAAAIQSSLKPVETKVAK